jgi:hypothetical protein
MKIECKDWTARDDRTPGVNTLTVSGTVTVNAGDVTPVLAPVTVMAAGTHLNLELQLQREGTGTQALAEKQVTYTQPSDPTVVAVQIYYQGKLLTSIKDIEVTH